MHFFIQKYDAIAQGNKEPPNKSLKRTPVAAAITNDGISRRRLAQSRWAAKAREDIKKCELQWQN
jgi:hypothetical protein